MHDYLQRMGLVTIQSQNGDRERSQNRAGRITALPN